MRKTVESVFAILLAFGISRASGGGEIGEFADDRDGETYRTVEIAGMTWFAENLAWAAADSFCYEDDESNCDSYGRLYRWEQAMSACPEGTHLSSEFEWQALERAIGLPETEIEQRNDRGSIEGRLLKPGGGTGFDALFGGWRRYEDGSFAAIGENAAFWTSTEADLAHAQHRDIDGGDDMIWRSPVVKHYALSIRCVVNRYAVDEYPGDDTHPVFSPDGGRVAYISNRDGVAAGREINFEIYVLDLKTRRERRLTFNDDFEADLAWSPDGSMIAFKSFRDGNDEIYLMNADGSDQVNVTRHHASDGSPSFTPDGRYIIFDSDRGDSFDLYEMPIDGSVVRPLTNDPASNRGPAVSKDGRKIAFVSDRDGNDEIYVLDSKSGEIIRVTDAPLSDWYPVWSPGGDRLIVTYGDWETDRWSVVLLSLSDGSRETLFEDSDSGNAAWRAHDGVVAFGAPTLGRDGETGPGRIHFGIPGGNGAQPVTGRLAGTVGDPED